MADVARDGACPEAGRAEEKENAPQMMDDKRFIAPQTRPTLCWSCARACGGCSWTERDPATHAIRFEPVKGWEAEKTTINGSKSEHGEKCYRYTTDSYRVVRCPLYVPDRRTRAKSAMPEWAMQAANA